MIGFARDIRPLFTERDRDAMSSWLDLWEVDQVREWADRIAERLERGDMPCDGAWQAEHVQRFKAWIADGLAG